MHQFELSEKVWLCEEICGMHTELPISAKYFSVICNRHHIPSNKLKKWLRLFRLGKLNSIDEISSQNLFQIIGDQDIENVPNLLQSINNEVNNTSKRR